MHAAVLQAHMICLRNPMKTDHSYVCNSHNIAILRADGSGIQSGIRQRAAMWPVQHQGRFQSSLFDTTTSARREEVPDLPMVQLHCPVRAQVTDITGNILCDAH